MRHRVDGFLGLRKRASISAGAAGLPRVAVSMKGRSFFPPGSNKNKSGYDIGLVHFAQELLVGSSDALLGRTPKNGGNFVSEGTSVRVPIRTPGIAAPAPIVAALSRW